MPHQFNPLSTTKAQLGPQIPAQAYRCGSPSSASAASFSTRFLTLLLSYVQQAIHPAMSSAVELTPSPIPLSQTPVVTLLFLGFNSITAAASQTLGAVEQKIGYPGRQAKGHQAILEVFPLFLTADRKRVEHGCHNNFTGEELCRTLKYNIQLNSLQHVLLK